MAGVSQHDHVSAGRDCVEVPGADGVGGRTMRLLYGFIAMLIWLFLMAAIDPSMSNELALTTTAIIVAGVMAGGD